ncbi:DNA methyltransferase, partial [Candidatus Roizmanbacteria bacterium CG_4_10_14_0_8_um_filter_39_9]
MHIQDYLNKLQTELLTGSALEHSYRHAFKELCETIDANVLTQNEPSRTAHGSPDYIFFKKSNTNIILGYAEAKDIWVNLNDIEKSEQLKRYLGYSNLILTNYIEFRFFRNGEKYQTIAIASRENTFLRSKEENFLQLEAELKAFLEGKPERIKSGKRLSQIMGGKALRIRENVMRFLQTENIRNQELEKMYEVMKSFLVHDLSVEKFADMYAQTLVYGLFVARYYDESPENFSRQEARDLVPASNPFLRHFFDHIIGPDFDKRLGCIVDELCDVFAVADIRDIIMRHFNLFGEIVDKDPIIHFYEDFLKEYDPLLRKSMGAYYTPVPVVQFMIRSVDEMLRKEFNLQEGIANTDKTQREVLIQGKKEKEMVHKVQILDPAVGTATFLNEIIKHIHKGFVGQEGVWQSYVDQELLPRLYGFELMMAPYTIAHLKLAMTLKETGINHFHRRLGVYLTNTLEEGIKHKDDLFSFGLTEAISEESKAAGTIKHDRPIMVVIGNPPYSGESNNKGLFEKEIEVYKREPTGGKLKERNPKWINDDYVKFIRFAEQMIEKNGEG